MLVQIFKRTWAWIDDRLGISALIVPIVSHPVPSNARWWYVFGSATLVAFMIQVVTGVALAFSYIPSAGEAHSTLLFISHNAPFGRFLRGLHEFGASAMVIMVGVHAIQVFLFGAYKYPREMNWLTGVVLLGLTLGMGFTGQLMRWDQTAVWSVVVAAEQIGRVPFLGVPLAQFTLGGTTVGGATLSRFFAIHVFIIPAVIFATIAIHLMLVLRHGVSEPPVPGEPVDPKTYRQRYEELLKKSGCPFWPDAAWRDILFSVGLVLVVAACAFFFGPSDIGKPPDPAIIQADPRPDWYLLWYFAILALMPPRFEQVFMILGPVAAVTALIILPLFFNHGERSITRRPWTVAIVVMIFVMIGGFWREGVLSPWSPDFNAKPLSAELIASTDPQVVSGARLFSSKACINCHRIANHGGRRGPDLSTVGDRLSAEQITVRIINGATNMPDFGNILKPEEVKALVTFLESRKRVR